MKSDTRNSWLPAFLLVGVIWHCLSAPELEKADQCSQLTTQHPGRTGGFLQGRVSHLLRALGSGSPSGSFSHPLSGASFDNSNANWLNVLIRDYSSKGDNIFISSCLREHQPGRTFVPLWPCISPNQSAAPSPPLFVLDLWAQVFKKLIQYSQNIFHQDSGGGKTPQKRFCNFSIPSSWVVFPPRASWHSQSGSINTLSAQNILGPTMA